MRRRSTDERVSVCAQCAQEVRQAKGSKQRRPQRSPGSTGGNALPRAKRAAAANPVSSRSGALQSGAVPASTRSPAVQIEGLLMLTLIVVAGGPLFGGLVALVSRLIYLIFAFPIGIGIIGGFAIAQGIRWGKVRVSLVGAMFGLLLGLFVYGSYRYAEYLLNKQEALTYIRQEIEAEYGEADPAIAEEVFDAILYEETGETGFWGSVLLDAKEGMSIRRRPYSPNSFNIGTTLTWVYWLLEMAAITCIPAFFGMEETTKPFCEHHGRWYEKEKSLGGIAPARAKEVIALLEADDYTAVGRALDQTAPVPGIEFFIEQCTGCEKSDPILTIKTVKRTSRGRLSRNTLSQKTITPLQGRQILEGMYPNRMG
jgi:hypothetical protein